MGAPYKPRLIGDYEFDEVSSALNKAIRRGLEYEAAYWTMIIHQSGYGQYLLRRLSTITSEDVGNADPQAMVLLQSVRVAWDASHKHTKEPTAAQLALILQVVQYLCQCKKIRDVDALRNLVIKQFETGVRLNVPELAKDPHCASGRTKYGRWGDKDGRERERLARWYSEGSVVTNPSERENQWLKPLQELEEKLIQKQEAEGLKK